MKSNLVHFLQVFDQLAVIKLICALLLMALFAVNSFGQVYSYTDTSQSGEAVIGYGSVTGYYNSSTHIYTTRVTVSAPSGRSTTTTNSGTSATAYLSLDFEHGNFSSSTSHEGTCPYSGYTHTVGGSGGSIPIGKFCSIGEPMFSTSETPATLSVSVVCSKDAQNPSSTTVTVQSYPNDPKGEWSLNAIPDQEMSISDGTATQFSFLYSKQASTVPTNCPCTCKGEARLSVPSGVGISGMNPRVTANTVTISGT